jgi:hypothetical protein
MFFLCPTIFLFCFFITLFLCFFFLLSTACEVDQINLPIHLERLRPQERSACKGSAAGALAGDERWRRLHVCTPRHGPVRAPARAKIARDRPVLACTGPKLTRPLRSSPVPTLSSPAHASRAHGEDNLPTRPC